AGAHERPAGTPRARGLRGGPRGPAAGAGADARHGRQLHPRPGPGPRAGDAADRRRGGDRGMSERRVLVELRDVDKVYGTGPTAVHAMRDVNLTIEEGDFVAIMEPSGSGKSTCMNVLGCLDTPTSGTYLFRAIHVGSLDRDQRAPLDRKSGV